MFASVERMKSCVDDIFSTYKKVNVYPTDKKGKISFVHVY